MKLKNAAIVRDSGAPRVTIAITAREVLPGVLT